MFQKRVFKELENVETRNILSTSRATASSYLFSGGRTPIAAAYRWGNGCSSSRLSASGRRNRRRSDGGNWFSPLRTGIRRGRWSTHRPGSRSWTSRVLLCCTLRQSPGHGKIMDRFDRSVCFYGHNFIFCCRCSRLRSCFMRYLSC